MLINSGEASRARIVIAELIIGASIVGAISFAFYSFQHPPMTQQERISAALQDH